MSLIRESRTSLRVYFLLVGVIGCFYSFFLVNFAFFNETASVLPVSMRFILSGVIVYIFIISSMFIYFGLKLQDLLPTKEKLITRTLLFGGVFIGINIIFSIGRGLILDVFKNIFGILFIWYLVTNIKRLSREMANQRVSLVI